MRIRKKKNKIGRRFGNLVVVGEAASTSAPNGKLYTQWLCRCDCGNDKIAYSGNLMNGQTTSCGCTGRANKEAMWKRITKTHENERFGWLTVIERVYDPSYTEIRWRCICDCGNELIVRGEDLRSGNSKSCGCWKLVFCKKHGKSKSSLFRIWSQIKQRCNNENANGYHLYGGRGIKMCKEWEDSFEQFEKDIGPRPNKNHSLDRIDNSKGYQPDNVRWATSLIQGNNKRTTKIVHYNGEAHSLREWSDITGIDKKSLAYRYDHKWPPDVMLTLPKGSKYKGSVTTEEQRKMSAARIAVLSAVKRGKITKPTHCEFPECTETELEGHHHKGYDKENELDVQWLCPKHHSRLDPKRRIGGPKAKNENRAPYGAPESA